MIPIENKLVIENVSDSRKGKLGIGLNFLQNYWEYRNSLKKGGNVDTVYF